MTKFHDITGQKFSHLTVTAFAGRNVSGNFLWECLCDCGQTRITTGTELRLGRSRSCGCKRSGHGMWSSGLYNIWSGMMLRCYDSDNKDFGNYGERGISVCERWFDIRNFVADMLPTYKKGLQLDRIDCNGNYEPSNCRWATSKQQQRNRRNNRLLTLNGVTKCMAEWAEDAGMQWDTLYRRLKRGMSLSEALGTPVLKP